MSICNQFQGDLEVGQGFNSVDLAGLNQRGDAISSDVAFVMPSEERFSQIGRHWSFTLPMSKKNEKSITFVSICCNKRVLQTQSCSKLSAVCRHCALLLVSTKMH